MSVVVNGLHTCVFVTVMAPDPFARLIVVLKREMVLRVRLGTHEGLATLAYIHCYLRMYVGHAHAWVRMCLP